MSFKPSLLKFIGPILTLAIVTASVASGTDIPTAAPASQSKGPVKVEIRNTGDGYQLYVDQKPFYIKGAGLEFGSPEKLAAHGGNSFRTWRADNGRESGREILDLALKNSCYVTMGLDLGRERRGFNYNDPAAVARQLKHIKKEVLKYKDHPALIIWAIGNELNLDATNMNVWNAVNDISKMIHEVDTNHLTTTPLAGVSKELLHEIKLRAPDLDLVSIQMYADIVNLPRYLHEAHWDGPYIITEWGATGHWEVAKTDWGAPLENDSTTKAALYEHRYEIAIAPERKQCLGSYVFLWGQKQERTPTWYGMFLASGDETAAVDALEYVWTGKWPASLSPQLDGAWLDGKRAQQNIHLESGHSYAARVSARSNSSNALTYSWEVMEESGEKKVGGDFEATPKKLTGLIFDANKSEIQLLAPAKPGAYRLFVYTFDGQGHAAHANIPFYVN